MHIKLVSFFWMPKSLCVAVNSFLDSFTISRVTLTAFISFGQFFVHRLFVICDRFDVIVEQAKVQQPLPGIFIVYDFVLALIFFELEVECILIYFKQVDGGLNPLL